MIPDMPRHVFGYTPEGYPKQILTPEEDARYLPMTVEEMRTFIAGNNWTFAKSMPKTPHYYLHIDQASSVSEFRRFVAQIRRTGYACRFFQNTLLYLDIGDWYYWSMGWPIDEQPEIKGHTIILNRAEKRLQGNYILENQR
jgi:hypothetical protein